MLQATLLVPHFCRSIHYRLSNVTESVIGASWSLAGFDCEPLQGDPYYGVSYSCSAVFDSIVIKGVNQSTYNIGASEERPVLSVAEVCTSNVVQV